MNQKLTDTLIRTEERIDGGISYTYQLIMRKGNSTADWQMPLYSFRVSMTDTDGKDRSAEACNIFSDAKKAHSFFDKIVKNLATPIDLAYIIEDEICC